VPVTDERMKKVPITVACYLFTIYSKKLDKKFDPRLD